MRKSYDFSNALQGVHHKDYREGHSVRVLVGAEFQLSAKDTQLDVQNPLQDVSLVSLDPDVKAVFADAESVNQALRLLIKAAKSAQELPKAG